jgi:hypothetical protein
MPVRLYMDHNVPRPITVGLRVRDIEVQTAADDSANTLPDPNLLDHATELGRVLFTHDDDLLTEGHRRQTQGIPFAGVIYCHQRRLSIGECIENLEIIAKVSDPSDLENRVTYLPY